MDWHSRHILTEERAQLSEQILHELIAGRPLDRAVRRHPQADGGLISKSMLIAVYRQMVAEGRLEEDAQLMERIRMKPVRTLSGVTTITILTKPWPCPGECIFCPDDARMPKSYLHDEPGAMRGLQNDFDPYRQVVSRLESLHSTGHPTNKIELLILGGTWSAYPAAYREEFILRAMDALNQTPSATLEEAQQRNQSARHRLVGLVIETRPDAISPRELARLRRLGVTKVQMGVQSLDERVLELNQRGHSAAEALRACSLLRAAGFKIVLHWMPNLLGATPDSDRTDFQRLFDDGCQPDEIKIYPCQLLENTRLYQIWREGGYTPYTTDELIELVADVKTAIPPWCRVNRVIRDIPSPHVVEGNRRTSLRKDILERLARRGQRCQCLRCREVRGEKVVPGELRLVELNYPAGEAKEVFIQYLTGSDRVAGYLRLSMPGPSSPDLSEVLPDLAGAALIREVHVYGQSLPVGRSDHGAAQHIGLGTGLLRRAEEIALRAGFKRMAVISSVGTRPWYRERGYQLEQTYMTRSLTPTQETGSAG